ncbi:hypothetical protein [uncultured Methanobrevibacter sp.]|uniref:hypothetical protein n=1 Tax=uncultured Methanobrevibacter sp. TaxID=253161 RepID=UPI0025E4C0A4|nr:hypothetical protein [uncultured Methanobrevibacter sp.]
MSDWLFLNATADPAELNVGKISTIKFRLDSYDDGSKNTTSYDASKMDAILELSQTLGELNKNITLIGEDVIYTAKQEGTASVTAKFESAFYTVNIKNNASAPIPTNITVDPTSLDLTVDETGTISATLNPPEAGNLEVDYDETIIDVKQNEKTGDWTVTGVAEGNATITFSFPGSEGYAAAENKTVNVTVNPAPEPERKNLTIKANAEPITVGENATVQVNGLEKATGDVSVIVNGKTYSAPINGGKANVIVPGLTETVTADVNYAGDDNYNNASTTVNITVNPNTVNIVAPDVSKYYGGPERFVVNVTDSRGIPLSNKNVTISINGRSYNRTTDENGTASLALNLNSGVYNVTSSIDNQTVSSVVTVLSTVNGTDVVKMYRNGTQYYATFRDSEGKYLADGTTIRFNINGVIYDRKISGEEGLAKLNINLEAGKYIITAMNLVTGESTANNITVLSRFTENEDLTKYYRNASQYTVKVIGDDGKPVGAGETVRFNINGVFYERTTNASGIAKMNINLQPGDYIITAEYKGDMVSNNIKVLPVLSAKDISMKYRDGTQFKATLVNGQGKPYAGQTVIFNINGVFYNRQTDSTGTAKLNINLMAGEYIITSSYNGANIANKITIRG